MERDFWIERWREGQIGFHEGAPNAYLTRFGEKLGARKRVLVPLCGKTEDMAWLAAQGHQVVGVEFSEEAVRAFFAEHHVTPREDRVGPFLRLSTDAVTLLCGDMFATTAEYVGAVDAFYDRAALVALPESMRARYVTHLRSLVPEGARGLVITFDYPQARMEGPPFAISEAELRQHYQGATLEHLAHGPITTGKLATLGDQVTERCDLVTL